MEPTGGSARAGWGTAIGLTAAVLLLSVFDALPLVALPLAVLLVALPSQPQWRGPLAGVLLGALVAVLSGGPMGALSRGWALLLGSLFLVLTVLRPAWGVLPRALSAAAGGVVGTGAWFALTGGWSELDWAIQEHFRTVASLAVGDLAARTPDAAWVPEFLATMQRMAELQWRIFPALLALQSVAALALAAWWGARLRRDHDPELRLRPLREFRFNDQLVWLLITGLLLVAFPLGAAATRMGANALVFMGALYALRGVAVMLFLAGAPSPFTVVFGALAAVFLYPLVLLAALLLGLGDTWLDVRGRAALASRT